MRGMPLDATDKAGGGRSPEFLGLIYGYDARVEASGPFSGFCAASDANQSR
jgi:hypothetical protein